MMWHMQQMGTGVWIYLIILILIIAGMYFIYFTQQKKEYPEDVAETDEPMDIQKKRYRRGEITRHEKEEAKKESAGGVAMHPSVIPRTCANLIQLTLSLILVVLSLHLIHLAIGHILFSFQADEAVDEIFNAIWLITVALAVFDLAGIIFEEISWQGTRKDLREFRWQFTKFLIVIITALLIESLVVFFRIAKKDVTLLIYPALAILAVCMLIMALGYYIRQSNSADKCEAVDVILLLETRYAKGEIGTEEFQEKMRLLKK